MKSFMPHCAPVVEPLETRQFLSANVSPFDVTAPIVVGGLVMPKATKTPKPTGPIVIPNLVGSWDGKVEAHALFGIVRKTLDFHLDITAQSGNTFTGTVTVEGKSKYGTVEKFGRLDIVFANAGINGVWAPIEDLKPTEWDKTLDVNLKGTYLTVHYAIPHLKKAGGGSVIITSSVNGNRTFSTAGASAYSSSKAAQVAFMKMAALELGRYDIRVNAVCPGYIHTNIEQRTTQRKTEEVEVKIEFPEGQPFINEGAGEPADVADTCLFLASDLSRHVSGVDIYVDGGASLLR